MPVGLKWARDTYNICIIRYKNELCKGQHIVNWNYEDIWSTKVFGLMHFQLFTEYLDWKEAEGHQVYIPALRQNLKYSTLPTRLSHTFHYHVRRGEQAHAGRGKMHHAGTVWHLKNKVSKTIPKSLAKKALQ